MSRKTADLSPKNVKLRRAECDKCRSYKSCRDECLAQSGGSKILEMEDCPKGKWPA